MNRTPPAAGLSDLRGRAVDGTLMLVAAVWGGSYLAAKDLTLVAPVLAVLALRYLVAALGLGAAALHPAVGMPRRGELRVGLLLGCTQAAVLVLETFGVAHTSATNAGLIISLTILLTPVVESGWRAAWLPPAFFAACAVAVLGVGLLVLQDGFRLPGWGDALMLAAALVRAVHVALVGRVTAGSRYSSARLTLVQCALGAVVLGGAAGDDLETAVLRFDVQDWLAVGYLGLACSVFAFFVQTWAVRRTSASRASLLMGTEPLWAAAIGVGLGGERLTVAGALGGALIVCGTYWGQRIEATHRLDGSRGEARGYGPRRRPLAADGCPEPWAG